MRSDRKKLTLFSLFLPIFLETVLKNLMSTVNVYVLSALSDDSVAAVGVATQIFNLGNTVFSVCVNGAVVVICQTLGARKEEDAVAASATALYLIAGFGVIFGGIFFLFAPCLISLMQVEEALRAEATVYLRILSLSGVFLAITTALSGIVRSYGKPRYGLYVSVFVNVLNAIGGCLVVFRPFPLPVSGSAGVAWMRVISEVCAMALMVLLFMRLKLADHWRRFLRPSLSMVKPILHIALPAGVETLSYNLSQTVTTAILATLGAAAISSKIYVQNIVHYVYLLGMALSSAAGILIGHSVGAGDYKEAIRINRKSLRITVCSNGTLSLVAMLFRYQLLGLFTDDPAILAQASAVMLLDIFVEIGRGVNHVEQSSLRAVSDVRVPMVISLVTPWCCSILFSWVLGVQLGMGLTGCWIAFGMEELTRCVLLMRRWNSRIWLRKLERGREGGD